MKLLNGRELAEFIKERQAKEVRRIKQANGISPKLVIIQTKDDSVINTYVRLKSRYGADIGVEVEVHHPSANEVVNLIDSLNSHTGVHGIIVQLPLGEPSHTERVLNSVSLEKDVDGLAKDTQFDPATPTAINWLLSGYNIDLKGKEILVIGQGALVGAPLIKMLRNSGLDPKIAHSGTKDVRAMAIEADVVISATGQPELIKPDFLKQGAVVIDAGTAVAEGKMVGDVADEVYINRDDLTITPRKGGVGPLTVAALFENVLRAARSSVTTEAS